MARHSVGSLLLAVAAGAILAGCGAGATASGAGSQGAQPSGSEWLLREESHPDKLVPVRWSDGARQPAFAIPQVNNQPVVVRNPSPNGRLFLTTISTPQGEVKAVVDRKGNVLRQLLADGLYIWGTDSATLCVIHNADGVAGDMRLGTLPAAGGPERAVYTFKHDPQLGFHGLLVCSTGNRRMVLIELEAPGTESPRVRHVLAMDFSGAVVSQHDISATSRVAVRVSPDARLWAEDPFDPSQPAIIRSTDSDQVVATLPGRGVRCFNGGGTEVLTQSALPVQGNRLFTLQLESLQTGAVLWRQTGAFIGAATVAGQPGLVLELGDSSAKHTRVVALDGRGAPRLVAGNAFLG